MLRITASRNATGAISYFREALSRQDYYAESKDVPGRWFGKTADLLGLKGTVGRQDFEHLVNNRMPGGHTRLTVRDGKGRRAGYDFTWNAPKSASLVFMLTGDEKILEAHRRAVHLAMQAIEANMQTQAGQGKDKRYVTTGNLAMAAFDHFTSRPVAHEGKDGKIHIPDPHLHSHCFVFNGTWNEEKKRFQAVEIGTIKKEAPYYEALYHASFANALKEAGYEIEQTSGRWEIKGITREMIEKFSSRTKEINHLAEEKGLTWAEDKAAVGAKTRLRKSRSVAESKLVDLWSERLTPAEMKAVFEAKKGAGRSGAGKRRPGDPTPEMAIDLALAHFLERKSVVSEKRVLGKALASGYGVFRPEEISAALAKRDDIIAAEKNGASMITTKEMIRQEDRMVGFAAAGKGRMPALHPGYEVKREYLNRGQRDAIAHVLSTNDQVSIVCGGAGTGKSTLFQEIRQAHEEKGRSIFAFAPSAEASRGVLREKGFEDATTIASLLASKDQHEKYRGQTLLIDEAGMVSIADMNSVFDIAKEQKARVILSGDWRQHHSIQAGDALRIINERAGLKIAHVNEIVRQGDKSQYKDVIRDLSQGRTAEGFEKLDRMGAIKEVVDPNQRHDMVAQEYLRSVTARRSAIVVSPTHAEGSAVTDAIRSKLKESGHVGAKESLYGILRDMSLTRAEKTSAGSYREGLNIQFSKPVAGFMLGKVYEVCGADSRARQVTVREPGSGKIVSLPLDRPDTFQVSRREEIALASGDQIRITKNGKTLDGTRLNNGQVLSVSGFDEKGNLRLSNGKTLGRDYMNFMHGYYRTSYSAQGKDAQDVIISQSSESFAASNQKQFYVSVSRGTERCVVYTDDKERLKEAVQDPDERMSARELLQPRRSDEHRHVAQRKRIIDFYRKQIAGLYGQERVQKSEQRVRSERAFTPSREIAEITR